jgi:hypothetical protein
VSDHNHLQAADLGLVRTAGLTVGADLIVHGGATCHIIGATGVNRFGTAMVCRINPVKPPIDGRARWGRAEPAPPPRRRRSKIPRTGQGLERRYVNAFNADNPPATAQLPQKLVDQLDAKQLGALLTTGGLPSNGTTPRRSDLEKLDRAGLIQDGVLTARGVDALRRHGGLDADQRKALDAQYGQPDTAPPPAPRTDDAPVPEPDNPLADWAEYDHCTQEGGCGAKPGRPCYDLRRSPRGGPISRTPAYILNPHPGRPKLPVPVTPPVTPPSPTEPEAPVQHHVTTIEGPDSAGQFGWTCICREEASGLEPSEVVEHAEAHGPLAADSPRPEVCGFCGEVITDENRHPEDDGTCVDCHDDDELAAADNAILGDRADAVAEENARAREADLAAQTAYAKVLTDPRNASVEDLATALGASSLDPDTRAEISRQLDRRRTTTKRTAPAGTEPAAAAEQGLRALRDRLHAGGDHGVTRDAADTLLDGLTTADLDALYVRFEVINPGGNKDRKRRGLVERLVGARLDYDAILHGGWRNKPNVVDLATATAAMDWTPYSSCPTCFAPDSAPCYDRRFADNTISYATTPHPARQKRTAGPVTDDPELAKQRAAYEKATRNGIPNLTDEELDDARLYKDGSPTMLGTLSFAYDKRHQQRMAAAEQARVDAARQFRLAGSNDDLLDARNAAERGSRERRELDRQIYVRSLPDRELAAEMNEPNMTDFDRQQYADEAERRGIARRPASTPGQAAEAFHRASSTPAAQVSDDDLAAAVQHVPNVPGNAYERDHVLSEAARRMYPAGPDAQPVTGAHSTAPIKTANAWGRFGAEGGGFHFHGDGVAGQTLQRLGADAAIDVDGQPLANRIGRIATDVDACDMTAQDGAEAVAALRARMPHGSHARQVLDWTVSQMACPPLPAPQMPAGTPEPILRLVTDLNRDFPIVRRDGREFLGEDHPDGGHTDGLIDVVNGLERGDVNYCGTRRFIDKVRGAAQNRRHESNGDRGKRAIDRRVEECIGELEEMAKANRTVFYPPDQRR